MDYSKLYENCRLCPRECGVNRLAGQVGFCREAAALRVAYVGAHFGEEPPITGTRGSGTLFFSGCSLRCSFCQNHQISHEGLGEEMEGEGLFRKAVEMVEEEQVHNVNLVTPDHFFPHVFHLTGHLRAKYPELPTVFNVSGYQAIPLLRLAEEVADIYLPDYKYADPALSSRLSLCGDYPERALAAISEMVRQKGFLEAFPGDPPLAKKGVLVRHLILPGHVQNSLDALTTLFLEFGRSLPLSLMSQYTPVRRHKESELNRSISGDEFDRVYEHALELGFENLFVQFPEESSPPEGNESPFLPDFQLARPFADKRSKH